MKPHPALLQMLVYKQLSLTIFLMTPGSSQKPFTEDYFVGDDEKVGSTQVFQALIF